ncbi:MAG: hypothetical protein IJ997_01325, partial [Mycoplasmataceae bacterium]|nr:hypothetical protein [Mycoplasmataceae bacterium]
MNKENLFREIYSLYSLINKQIDAYTSVNKENIIEIKEAQKTLRGLYNQYDCIKTNVYSIIVTGINWRSCSTGIGILTDSSSGSPFGYPL